MKLFLSFITLLLFLSSCSTDSVKDKINKAGNVSGQVVGEFTSGVASGISEAFEDNLRPSNVLTSKGLSFGKVTVSSDSAATDNVLTVYVIFNEAYQGALTAKAVDKKGLEMGRCKLEVKADKDDARYLEFRFDKRTNIDHDSQLIID